MSLLSIIMHRFLLVVDLTGLIGFAINIVSIKNIIVRENVSKDVYHIVVGICSVVLVVFYVLGISIVSSDLYGVFCGDVIPIVNVFCCVSLVLLPVISIIRLSSVLLLRSLMIIIAKIVKVGSKLLIGR